MSRTPSSFIVGLLVGIVAASALFAGLGAGTTRTSGATARVLRVAHALPTSHPVHIGIEYMARRAEELSSDRLRLQIFPNEQLGNETQCLEQAQAGTLDITKVSAGVIGNFVSSYKVFSLPYLFRDSAHMWKVLNGPIGKHLLDLLSVGNDGKPSGLVGLCFYDSGSRNFYSTTPIRTPADLKGMKIRTMADPVAMETVAAMGAAPTPISFGELYTSLQQGVVEGAENNAPTLLSSRHYEVAKYFTLDAHSRIPDVLVASSKVWATLSPDERAWIRQAAAESSDLQRTLWKEKSAEALDQLRALGVHVEQVDTAPFRRAAEPVLEKYSEGPIEDLVQQIQAVQ